MRVTPTLTTRRTAGIWSGVAALLTTLITSATQYAVAIAPARVEAEEARRQLAATAPLQSQYDDCMTQRDALRAAAPQRESDGDQHAEAHNGAASNARGGSTVTIIQGQSERHHETP
jgi:type II secretory pathway component PulM